MALGFHLLASFWVLQAFFPTHGMSPLKVGLSLLILASTACFAAGAIEAAQDHKRYFDGTSKVLLATLLIWCLVTILRGLTSDPTRLLTLVANPNVGGLVWVLPFAVLLGRRPGVLTELLPVFRLHTMIGLAFAGAAIVEQGLLGVTRYEGAFQLGMYLLYAGPVVLLTGVGTAGERRFYLLALVIEAAAHFALENRAPFILTLLFILMNFALAGRPHSARVAGRLLWLGVSLAVIAFFVSEYLLRTGGTTWSLDTRTFLIKEMKQDLDTIEWIFGRGALGTYYSPYFRYISELRQSGDLVAGDSMIRQVSEIGYLHIALKMGTVGVVVYVLMMLRGAQAALRRGTRQGIGILLIIGAHLLEMTIVGQAVFRPSRVLLWMLVGVAITHTKTARGR